MSYTPPEQYLGEHIATANKGIDGFIEAAQARLDESSGEWTLEHLQELADLLPKLQEVRVKMSVIGSETH